MPHGYSRWRQGMMDYSWNMKWVTETCEEEVYLGFCTLSILSSKDLKLTVQYGSHRPLVAIMPPWNWLDKIEML